MKDGLMHARSQQQSQGMFGADAMSKLMNNERTRKYFENQDFINKFEAVQQNPDLMQQLIQTDPRFMDVFSTITGIDLLAMQE